MPHASPESVINALHVTIADLEARFSSEDPSAAKMKSILFQRIADLQRELPAPNGLTVIREIAA